jgi:glutamine amidotransferase
MKKVAIVDYGMGNVASVGKALAVLGSNAVVISRPQQLGPSGYLILPGVGSFADGMRHLSDVGWVEAIREHTLVREKPLLGICLGMQLLSTWGDEGAASGGVGGLNLIPGEIQHLRNLGCALRVPHVGWDSVSANGGLELLSGVPVDTDFYFVHSYAFKAEDMADVFATCDYGATFAAIIGRGYVWGTQFHPEKSSSAGLRVLKNFLEL